MKKIRERLLNLEGFQYATSLDLNMSYCYIRLSEEASNLYTIIPPQGKYKYKRLPMGVCNSPEIFQEKMNEIFYGIEFIRAYINDLLVITKGNWYDHLNESELVLKKLIENGLKWNIEKWLFVQTDMEYMDFCVTRTGIRPVNKELEAIVNMTPTRNKRIGEFIHRIS